MIAFYLGLCFTSGGPIGGGVEGLWSLGDICMKLYVYTLYIYIYIHISYTHI